MPISADLTPALRHISQPLLAVAEAWPFGRLAKQQRRRMSVCPAETVAATPHWAEGLRSSIAAPLEGWRGLLGRSANTPGAWLGDAGSSGPALDDVASANRSPLAAAHSAPDRPRSWLGIDAAGDKTPSAPAYAPARSAAPTALKGHAGDAWARAAPLAAAIEPEHADPLDSPPTRPWTPAPHSRAAVARRRLLKVAADFEAVLDDVADPRAQDLTVRLRLCTTLQELWHLRPDLFDLVSRAHSQTVAQQRLAQLDRHFPSRTVGL